MKVTKYWVDKLLWDFKENLPIEESSRYSLVYAGYLALGYDPIPKGSTYEPSSDVVDLVKEMKKEIVSMDANYHSVSPWEIFVAAEYIRDWAEYLGNGDIYQTEGTSLQYIDGSEDDKFDYEKRNEKIQAEANKIGQALHKAGKKVDKNSIMMKLLETEHCQSSRGGKLDWGSLPSFINMRDVKNFISSNSLKDL